MQSKVVILGAAGAIGKATTLELIKRGIPVRVVGRDQTKLEKAFAPSGAEIKAADLATVDGCVAALTGCEAAIYSIGLPYFKTTFAQYPVMMRVCLDAARQTGLKKLILISNVYPYGRPWFTPVTEEHPRIPCSVKGEFRKQQEDIALAAHDPIALATLSLRLPDFYGYDAEKSLAWNIFSAAVKGKTANVLDPIDTPHQFFFTPDIGPIIADLLDRPEAFGASYNVAGAGSITIREFARRVYAEVGMAKPKVAAAGRKLLTVLGLFSPLMRELREMAYLLETPVILNDSKLRRVLPNMRITSYDDGIRATLDSLRS